MLITTVIQTTKAVKTADGRLEKVLWTTIDGNWWVDGLHVHIARSSSPLAAAINKVVFELLPTPVMAAC